jgi:glycerol-3-phosphate dehydrogenase
MTATGELAAEPRVDLLVVGGGWLATLRLVKGSHIIVPRLFDHAFAYIFQAPDRRIVFAIPYELEFTLVGTTDIDHRGPPDAVRIDPEEIAYLCGLANRYFRRQIGPADVVATYSGIRPLLDDESASLLTVFGGKFTTYRVLAEEAVNRLAALRHRYARAYGSGFVR